MNFKILCITVKIALFHLFGVVGKEKLVEKTNFRLARMSHGSPMNGAFHFSGGIGLSRSGVFHIIAMDGYDVSVEVFFNAVAFDDIGVFQPDFVPWG